MGHFKINVFSREGEWTKNIEKERFIVGRSKKADITIKSNSISREHLLVYQTMGHIYLMDLNTSNGTHVEKSPIPPQVPFPYRNLDGVQLGDSLDVIRISFSNEENKQVEQAQEDIKTLEEKTVLKESEYKILLENIEEHHAKMEKKFQEKQKNLKNLEEEEETLSKKVQELDTKKKGLEKKELEYSSLLFDFKNLSHDYQEQEKEHASITKDLKEISSELLERKREYSSVTEKLKKGEERIKSLEDMNFLKGKEYAVLLENIEEHQSKGQKAFQTQQEELRELEREKIALSEKVQKLAEQRESWDEEKAQLEQRSLTLQKREEDFKAQSASLMEKTQKEIAMAHLKEEELLKKRRIQEKRNADQRKGHQINEITRNLEVMILNKSKSLENQGAEIKRIVSEAFEEKSQAVYQAELQRIMPLGAGGRGKVRRFWIKTGLAMTISMAILFLFIFPEIMNGIKRGLASLFIPEKSASHLYVERVQKKREERPKFQTKTTPGHKKSYTDNILYTENYLANKQEEIFHKTWVLELNHFFVNKLKLSENTITHFIAIEASLIKELKELKGKINPLFVKEGIERMRQEEAQAVKRMKALLYGHERYYLNFETFRRDFYTTYSLKNLKNIKKNSSTSSREPAEAQH